MRQISTIIIVATNLLLLVLDFSFAFAPQTSINHAPLFSRTVAFYRHCPQTYSSKLFPFFGATLDLSKRSRQPWQLYAEPTTTTTTTPAATNSANSSVDEINKSTVDATVIDEDDEEYEEIEYELLTEAEFMNAELLVGTNWDRNPDKIAETWVRLVVDKDGKNVAVWGDGAQGTWKLDVPSQFLSLSKENRFAGKDIWACTVNDYYYFQGTVRGWKYWRPAAVLGQWQARRLGVSKEEAGTPPWFENENDEDSNSNMSE